MEAIISNIHTNCLGTTDFCMKLKDMRKPQEFTTYAISRDDTATEVTIQSDKRIGRIDIQTGKGLITKSYNNPGFAHYTVDQMKKQLVMFQLSPTDLQAIRTHIFTTASSKAGAESGICCDNSGAFRVV